MWTSVNFCAFTQNDRPQIHLVSRRDRLTCMITIFPLCMTTWFEPANFFFPLFSLCTSSSQPISFLFPPFFPHFLYMHNPTWIEWSLENTLSWFFWFVFGIRHNLGYFENDHSKSKVLGYMTAQHLIFISTSANIMTVLLQCLDCLSTHLLAQVAITELSVLSRVQK